MKTITVLAVALGLGSLAACNQAPKEEATDNIEANAEVAEVVEENTEAVAMDANAAAPADAAAAEGDAAAPAAEANAN